MPASGSGVASRAAAESMLRALRELPWDARAAVLACLRTAELPLWLRCVVELGDDEVVFSGMAVPAVEDLTGPIALPDVHGSPQRRRRLRCKTRVVD